MTLSPIGTSFDNAFCMPSSALNSRVPALNSNSMTNGNTNAYFAKKGEPMYMKEMDADAADWKRMVEAFIASKKEQSGD